MNADSARFLADFLLPQLASEHRVTCRVLNALPDAHHDYRPHAKAMSAMELARHIVICEIWFLEAVLAGKCGEFPAHLTVQDYPATFADCLSKLEILGGESFAVPMDFHGLRTEPAVAFLSFALRHTVHHRGQFSAYLRAMGVPVPAIYVESADEPDLEHPPAF